MTAVIQAFILAKVVGMGRYSFDDMGYGAVCCWGNVKNCSDFSFQE